MKRFFVTFVSVGFSFSSFITLEMCSGNGNQPNPLLTQVQPKWPGRHLTGSTPVML